MSGETEKISLLEASYAIAKRGMPFAISRMAMSSFASLGVAFVLREFGSSAVSADPYILSTLFVTTGLVRGVLSSTGLLVGQKNGAKDYAEIGKIMRQSWLLSMALSLIPYAVLADIEPILAGLSIDASAAAEAQSFFNGYLLGISPLFFYICDAQLAGATKDGRAALVSGLTYAALSAAIGTPMALGCLGDDYKGAYGLGMGISIAGWATVVALRLYFACNSHYHKFGLHKIDFAGSWHYLKELFLLGLKMGAQVATEWGNLTMLTILLGSLGGNTSQALQASLMCLASFNLLVIGFGQAMGQLMANEVGAMRKALENNNADLAAKHRYNFNQLGDGGLVVGGVLSSTFALCAGLLAQPFARSFLSSEGQQDDALVGDAGRFLWLNAVGLLADTSRNLASGALQAYKEIMYPTTVSFFLMSLVGLGLAAGLIFGADAPAYMAIVVRDVTILASALLIINKLKILNRAQPSDMIALIDKNEAQRKPSFSCRCFGSHNGDQGALKGRLLTNDYKHTP